MPNKNVLEKVKKLRELTGAGFKDCKNAIDENNGDIDKSIEYLRKKGIVKANKKMERIAADGLISISEKENKFSIVEVNSETDFVAKNEEFINFTENLSKLALINNGTLEKILVSKVENRTTTKDKLVEMISKIGEKISIRRSDCLNDSDCINFSYMHASVKENIGKLGVILSLETKNKDNVVMDLGHKLAMQVAASNPIAINTEDLDSAILKKEEEIIKEELKNSGKNVNILDKIAKGKLIKFIEENTLMNQNWILDPKLKVKDAVDKVSGNQSIRIKNFVRYKVGEGI